MGQAHPTSSETIPGGRTFRPIAVAVVFSVAVVASLAAVLIDGGRLSWNTPLFANDHGFLSCTFLALAAYIYLHGCRGTEWDAFSPLRLFYGTWFGLLALGCLRLSNAEAPLTLRFWVTVALGLLGFYLGGYGGAQRGKGSSRLPFVGFQGRWELNWRPRRALVFIVGLFILCVLAFGYEWLRAGVVPLFAGDTESARWEFGVNSYVSRFAISFYLVIILGYLGMAHIRKYRVVFLAMAVASGAALTLMTGRTFILTGVWVSIVLFHYGRRRITARALLVVALIAYPLAKIAVDVKRFHDNPAYTNLLDKIEFPERLRPVAPDYLYFSMTLRTLDYLTRLVPQEIDYAHGWYIGYPIRVFWTPRQGTGFRGRLDDLFWERTEDVSPVPSVTTSYMGVPYADFGLAGVFLFSCIFGWVSVRCYESMRRQPTFWRVFLYSQISFAIFWSLYASYLTLFDFYWNLAMVGLVHHLASDKAKQVKDTSTEEIVFAT